MLLFKYNLFVLLNIDMTSKPERNLVVFQWQRGKNGMEAWGVLGGKSGMVNGRKLNEREGEEEVRREPSCKKVTRQCKLQEIFP